MDVLQSNILFQWKLIVSTKSIHDCICIYSKLAHEYVWRYYGNQMIRLYKCKALTSIMKIWEMWEKTYYHVSVTLHKLSLNINFKVIKIILRCFVLLMLGSIYATNNWTFFLFKKKMSYCLKPFKINFKNTSTSPREILM